MLNQGWLTEEQADEWFGTGTTDQTANEAEQSAESSTRDIKPANLPKWEEVTLLHVKATS
jgi:hypothetical protein